MGVLVRKRKDKPGWWVIANHQGKRTKKCFGSNKKAAEKFAMQLDARLKLGELGIARNSGTKFEQYAATWLDQIKHTRKHSTYVDYQRIIKRDLAPLHALSLLEITRDKVKAIATAGLSGGQATKTVQNVIRCLSSLLSQAVEDRLVTDNVALRLGKFLP